MFQRDRENRKVIPTSRKTSGTQHHKSPASMCQARPRGKTCIKADHDISEHQGNLDDARWGGGGEQGSEPMAPTCTWNQRICHMRHTAGVHSTALSAGMQGLKAAFPSWSLEEARLPYQGNKSGARRSRLQWAGFQIAPSSWPSSHACTMTGPVNRMHSLWG